MSDTKTDFTLKTIIIAMAVVLIFSFAILLVQKKTNPKLVVPVAVKSTAKPTPSPSAAPVVTPEPMKIRYISGVIKEVKKSSVIVVDAAAKKETEIGFNKTTKILIGEGSGKDAAISDLAADWNVAIFLPEDKDNNIAQRIQMVVKTPAK